MSLHPANQVANQQMHPGMLPLDNEGRHGRRRSHPVCTGEILRATWAEVTSKVLEILQCHVPVGQVGVFLSTLYQVMCTQQQGITSMVVAQARAHLCINNWVTQVSLTQLFTQVIPGLGSLTSLALAPRPSTTGVQWQTAPAQNVQYTPIFP